MMLPPTKSAVVSAAAIDRTHERPTRSSASQNSSSEALDALAPAFRAYAAEATSLARSTRRFNRSLNALAIEALLSGAPIADNDAFELGSAFLSAECVELLVDGSLGVVGWDDDGQSGVVVGTSLVSHPSLTHLPGQHVRSKAGQ